MLYNKNMEITMKKLLTALSCVAVLASTVSADFGRVEMGIGGWGQTPSGDISYTESGVVSSYGSDKKADTSTYAWLLVKHPIPIVPNIRLEYTNINDTGVINGDFKDFNLPAGVASTTGSLTMTQYDIVPYYNILDNTFWMTVDVGVDIKVLETDYTANGVVVTLPGFSGGTQNYSDTATVIIPLAYLRARVEIPATNIGVESDVKYISYSKSTMSDVRIKVDYTLDFVPVIQPAIEVGYRLQSIDLNSDDEKTKMKMDFSGVYAGIMLRF